MIKKIAVLPGDGIGPEIIKQAVKVAEAIAARFHHELWFEYAQVGASAIDSCGDPYPDKTDAICKSTDAVLFGAIGDPKYDLDPSAKIRPEQGLLRTRKSLGLFANIRPVCPYKSLLGASPLKPEILEGTDMVIIRELTGGMYFGEPRGRSEDGETAFDTCLYSRDEIFRIAEVGFKYALRRKGRLTLVDKANVLATSRLWRETVTDLHEMRYPEVELEYMYVDNAAMQLVSAPSRFDVILTENMFGDILSDVGGVINGSIGLLPSASIGASHALYEPIHGSYPQAAGKDIANPIATILSLAMLFENSFQAPEEAAVIRAACAESIAKGICTPDIFPGSTYGTESVGDYIAKICE